MNSPWNDDWPNVVAGFGSPHGDDQAGWRLAAILQQTSHVPARVLAILEPTQLIEALANCQRLILVDACRHGKKPGAISRLRWPDPRIVACHSHSTHGMGVSETLRLAERLGRLPPLVEVYGIEIADCSPGADVSPVVSWAVGNLAARILEELREVAHA